jgi:hypothetical protein
LGEYLEVPIFSNNQVYIALAKDSIAHSRTKYIEVRYHYIRDLVAYGKATVTYYNTKNILADILTKPLSLPAYKRCIQELISLE